MQGSIITDENNRAKKLNFAIKAITTHMMVVHIFNHVRVNETPRDLWQDKAQHFIDDLTSIGPKVKLEKIGIKTNPG